MRAQSVDLVTVAVVQKIQAYVLVNNRAEGNAPLTIQALVARMASGPAFYPYRIAYCTDAPTHTIGSLQFC